MRKTLKILAGVAVIAALMNILGLSAGDVLEMLHLKAAQAGADTQALMSGEYSERISRQLSAEAAQAIDSQPPAAGGLDGELQRELSAERKRIMEEKARALEQRSGMVLSGDIEALKKQVVEQARQAGGDN